MFVSFRVGGRRLLRPALLAVLVAASGVAFAAPGDPVGPLANVAAGGVLNHDPFFKDNHPVRALVGLTGGNVVAAWSSRPNAAASPDSPDGANGKLHGAFFKILSGTTGTPVSGVVAPYLDINADGTGRQNTPQLAALSGGGFVMVWNSAGGPGDTYQNGASGGDAYGRVYSATGTPVSGTFHINENDPNGAPDEQDPAAVVGLTGGGFAVVWHDENDASGNTDDYFLRVYSANGTPQAASVRLGGAGQNAFFKDFDNLLGGRSLIALANGNVAVAWSTRDQNNDGTGVSTDGGGGAGYIQVFNAAGAAVSGLILPYADINPDGSGNQDAPQLAALAGGGFVATWNSNRNTNDPGFVDAGAGFNGTTGGEAYARTFNDSGVGTSTTVRVNDLRTDDSEYPYGVVALTGGGFAIVWKEDDDATGNTDDFYARAFTAGGAPAGPSIMIAGPASDALFDDYDAARGLIALDDGGFAAGVRVRTSGSGGTGTSIDGGGYASAVRLFNANGTARTGVLFPYTDINPNGSGSQNIPKLAATSGGFAVTWNSAHNEDDGANNDQGNGSNATSGGDTWVRLFNNAGNPVHASIRVHDSEPTGTPDEQTPQAIVKAGSGFAVLMRDENNATGNTDDLYARVFGDVPAAAPEIAVEQPAGTNIADGGSKAFGSIYLGSNTSLTFTIRNSGTANLTGLAITKTGANPGDFTVTANPTAPVAASGTTTFTVQFAPGAAGARSADIHIASNDADENPFDITLTGTGVALPNLSINDVSLNEGNSGTTTFAFTVSLSAPAGPGGVTFDIATANNTAVAPGDYAQKSLTAQTIPAGSSTYAFSVLVNGDLTAEANETFFVNVTNVTNATVTDAQGQGTIVNDDVAGFAVTPTTGLVTTEAGGTAAFTVALTSQPTANVTVALSSSDTSEGTVSPSSLTFTPANWSTAQPVTVTGVDDAVDDGDVPYTVLTGAAASADGAYNGMNPADVAATNLDDDAAGIVVSPTSGLVTTEAGGVATFAVVLTSQPTADVTIPLSSSDAGEGIVVGAPGVTFTAANWNVPQNVSVIGVDDLVDDGDVAYAVVTAPAISADPGYNGRDAADAAVTNLDDDTAAIAVSTTGGLNTTEAGGTATFTIVLGSQPTADVTIALSSSDTGEGTVAPASVTFTAANWNGAQTVTVTGVDDDVDDGDVAYTILTAPATSADAGYSGRDAADVGVTNTDDDTAGIVVAPIGGLVTTEAGGSASFAVALASQPTADVTIALSSSDTGEGTVSPASITFTAANWSSAQTVTVSGVDDALDDGDVAYTIVTAPATSSDPGYAGRDADDVAVSNTDDDTAGVSVTPALGLVTSEAGATAAFNLVLDSQPTADVTIALASDDPGEGTALPASVTFTPLDWDQPQTVTVTGVDDFEDDGDVVYAIVTDPAASADPSYDGVDADDVEVTNTDNDTAGITVAPTAGLATTEAGGTATFTVVLNTQPTADVTIGLSSSDAGEGTAAPASVVFTPADWNVAQTVTVTGVDDPQVDGSVAYSIVTAPATSADPNYAGIDAEDVAASNADDDVAGIAVSPTAGLVTSEAGGTATFTIALNTQPSADVTIALSSNDTGEGTVAPASVTFTASDWNVPQTVTATGVDDPLIDGDVAYSIVTAAAVSGDADYAGVNAADVMVTNTDDDTAGITVSPTAGLVTSEAGGSATFTVVLNTQPSADVTIALSSDDTGEGDVAPASVTFTAANWNTAQTVTVTGVDDALADGDVAYAIVTAPAVSTDADYSGIDAADVSVTNSDDDAAGITVSPTAGLVTSEAGGTASFSVVLRTQPTADVTIALSSSDTGEGTVAPSSVTFTAANWNTAQSVTVTGVDDALGDGDVAYTIITAAAVSADANYAGLDAPDVSVTNSDDDATGITVSPTAGLVTSEAGGSASFSVVLRTQPTADVTIALSSSDTGEGVVAPASLTFTTANWNAAQTATVTGVDDALGDGDIAYSIVTAPATSADPGYAGVDPPDVAVINTDDDSSGVSITPTVPVVTSEAGGSATLSIVLNAQPSADVTIPFASSDTGEATVAPASVTFTPANWNVAQSVTITGVDDVSFDGDVAYAIQPGPVASADPVYQGVALAPIAGTNTDDETDRLTASTATGSGPATIVIAGGQCSLDPAQSGFVATSGLQLPTAVSFPHGAVALRAQGCAVGTSLAVTLTFPSRPADWALWKLGTASVPATIAATASGATSVAYTIVDGGPLDADGAANGVIVDPVALGVPEVPGAGEVRAVPVDDPRALAVLLLLLAVLGGAVLRGSRGRSP
ncbi:choice-of-anchor U domain-containing protein [Dokdonella sp.]|uniref:beta strand repeat-containing protein n=1 Tax=Dokdonella sp. TaxID=2291710 RepID=UPI001B2B62E8|nr:choice-of-anchor U domain-containing protein [Dokdonella sp.]MBO9664109.1 choice-of-anchor D domain-containing protein [Dokdonella sp.]